MSEKEQAQTEEKVARVATKEPTEVRREPKPGSKKDVIFQAGRQEEPGSIKALAEQTNTTESNIRQHITQCHTVLGFGTTVSGDSFTVDGDVTLSWEDQLAEKEKAKAAKKEEEGTDPVNEEEGEVEEAEVEDDDILA